MLADSREPGLEGNRVWYEDTTVSHNISQHFPSQAGALGLLSQGSPPVSVRLPSDAVEHLRSNYGPNFNTSCASPNFDHRTKLMRESIRADCQAVADCLQRRRSGAKSAVRQYGLG
jgi:hypothetical protein